MSHYLLLLAVAAAFAANGANAINRKCANVELTFPLTGNTTMSDEFLAADSANTRRHCTISGIASTDLSRQDVFCSDVGNSRRLLYNWPTGGSRDFFFSTTDPLRGLVYVPDRQRGVIFVCSTSATSSVALPCAVATTGRTQPKQVALMPPNLDGMAWIETAGRGVFAMGSTMEMADLVSPKQILLGEFAAMSFDMKPVFNADTNSVRIVLYVVAKNSTVFSVQLERNGNKVDAVGEIVNVGKLRGPDVHDGFFARPLRPVVSIAVYDRVLYYATSKELFHIPLVARQTQGFASSSQEVLVLSTASPVQMHSVSFDGTNRRTRPRIAHLGQACRGRIDLTGIGCSITSDTKKICEQNKGICLAKRNGDNSTTETCVCPLDYSMSSDNKCVRWRTSYMQLATRHGLQRYEIASIYSQDAYGAYPTVALPKDKPGVVSDDTFFAIEEVNDFNDVTYGDTVRDAIVFQKFNKRFQLFTKTGDISILLRNEAAAKYMQYEPRSKKLYWLDDARHMIIVMDPYSKTQLTRPIFWHKDLVAFHLDPRLNVIAAVLLTSSFAYQNKGFVRHSTLSFVRCNMGGRSCSYGAADMPIDERNSSIISAYDIYSHRLYVIRDRSFPATRLTLTSVDFMNWGKFPDTVRLSVTPNFVAVASAARSLPLFSVFRDRAYFVVSPSNSTGSKTFAQLFAGALYRRTNPAGIRSGAPMDIQGPLQLPLEVTPSSPVIKFQVGYLYDGSPRQLGMRLNCSKGSCTAGSEICINNTCLCSPDAADLSKCSSPIDLAEGFRSVKGNYTWSYPPKVSECKISDINCVSALRRMCDGLTNNRPNDASLGDFNDEDLRVCLLAGFRVDPLQKSAKIQVTSNCEVPQDELCNNKTSPVCRDNSDESAPLCVALRKLPGFCASSIPIKQCFLTPDSLPRTTRNWFFQGRTGGPPPRLNTDAPQCIVDNARRNKFRCVCPSWAMASSDLTRCVPNNPCLDTETNTDHCAPNGRCRYSDYSRRDFLCDCNPGYVSPPGRSDACMDPMAVANINSSHICSKRIEICSQRNGAGTCIPGPGSDPTMFSCRCNLGFKLSRNGMDCIPDRTQDIGPSHSNACFQDKKICGQDRGAGQCVVLSGTRFYCICNSGYDATQDGRNCVVSKPVSGRVNNEIKHVFFEAAKNGSIISRSAFAVAFKEAFRATVVTTEQINRFKADASLMAMPLLIADTHNVIELSGITGQRRARYVLRNTPNKLIGVASNRMLGVGYVLALKQTETQVEIGAFVLSKSAANISKSDPIKDVEFFRVPFLGEQESMDAPDMFAMDASVKHNLLAYTTNSGRSLVTCSSFLSPSIEHQTAHGHYSNQPSDTERPLFGGMDCITLIREFNPTFTSIDFASRQKGFVWTDMPPTDEDKRRLIPSVSQVSIPEMFALEYSRDDPGIYARNVGKRRSAVHEFWLGKSAGAPGQNLVMAYDAINDRLTWMYGFEYVEDDAPEMANNNVFGMVVTSFDYNQQLMIAQVFAEIIIPKSALPTKAIYSRNVKLSISNGVAALTLPNVEQLWLFAVPLEDSRIHPVIRRVPKIVAAAFPAATPETYEKSSCDGCFGVCLQGMQETVCICPENNVEHPTCTPLDVIMDSSWHHYIFRHGHPATVAVIIIIILLLIIGIIAATVAFVVRYCGGVAPVVNRVRVFIQTRRRPDDVRPIHDDDESVAEDGVGHEQPKKKRSLNVPSLFHQNPSGYVAFDKSSDNVSLNSSN